MRLYLSSHGFGDQLATLQDMVGENKKVLFIDNAKDDLDDVARKLHVIEKKAEFEAAGLEFYELDLRNYFGKPEQLAKIVNATGLLWVSGGNTFIVRRAMAYCGLDTILQNALKNDQFVYGGSSAGAIIATKTLRGTEMGDDPYIVPADYDEEIIWNGLGLLYLQLVPHYQSEWFGDEAQAMVDYFEENGLKYATLRDGEVYIVNGEIEERV